MRQVHLASQTLSLPLLSHPFLVLLQYGLSTSLLSVRQWYQAKNASSVDSRHTGTGASTSASEPAGWGIHSSRQVNTAALWTTTLSRYQCECECVWNREWDCGSEQASYQNLSLLGVWSNIKLRVKNKQFGGHHGWVCFLYSGWEKSLFISIGPILLYKLNFSHTIYNIIY